MSPIILAHESLEDSSKLPDPHVLSFFVDDRAALTPFAVPVDIQTREARPGIRVLPNVKRG